MPKSSMPSMRFILTFAVLAAVTGCPSCVPGKVGTGVARLTIRNVGAMVSLVNANTQCGFASQSVLGSPTVSGTPGGPGSITFTVTDCVIDAGAGLDYSTSCDGTKSTATGKVTISATRTVTGHLTGNPMSPVIPGGPDAVTITVTKATFEKFSAGSVVTTSKLTMNSGSISAVVKPRLAVSKSTGACAIATPNVAFSDVKYAAMSDVTVESQSSGVFSVGVDDSNLTAQNGVNGDASNALSGTITVFGKSVEAPADGMGLDPEYDNTKFEASYVCATDLATPVSYMCADLRPRLAGGVARLTVRTIGTITSMIDANTMCGFSSMAVGGTPMLTGTVGRDMGTATFTISAPCTITLPANTLLSTDCNGVTARAGGTVAVTGTKRVTGFRTGNPRQPIVPTSRDPAQFDLSITFTNFEVVKSDSTSSLLVKSGTLTGKVAPRTALDSATGACSISTPVVTFSDMSWANAPVQLNNGGNKFDFTVGASMLGAQNGTKGTTSNQITGSITVDTMPYPIMAGGEPLDTAFTQSSFDASYACTPRIVIPPVDAACSFRQALGTAAARLLVKNAATATSMVNGNTTCGFASAGVLMNPTNVTGTAGMMGSITWSIINPMVANPCTIGPIPANTTISMNCLGGLTKASGTVTATGTKMVVGMRANSPPIIPVTREAATLAMSNLTFNTFELYDLAMGATMPTSSSILTGTASVTVKPVAGESTANMGVFSVSTPVAAVEMLTMPMGTIVVQSDGNRFELALTNVALEAFTGRFGARSNVVSGTLTVDGQPVTIAANTALDPNYMQAVYDSTYVCTPDLRAVVP